MQAAAADGTPAATQNAAAGNELEEVIVTAERRTIDIQNVAASVSVRTGEELAAQGRYTTRQILEDVPGIVAVDNNSRNNGSSDVQGNNITIRGIAPGPGAAGGAISISPAAGAAVYVDGVYEGIGSGYDNERVEVLRGPQGTLYGRSATTGVVAFHTRNPNTDGFAGNASAEGGNYQLKHFSGGVNIPLATGLSMRVSGDYYDQAKGYFDQASRGVSNRRNGRVKVLWQPTDTFSLLVGTAYEQLNTFGGGTTYTALLPSFNVTTRTSVLVPGFKETWQYWAEANLDLGPVRITYLPSFRNWTQDDTSITVQAFGTDQNLRSSQQTPKDNFITHELRFASKDDAALQWQGGFFYYRNTLNSQLLGQYESAAGVKGAITSESKDNRDTRNLGVFAETTIPFGQSLRMTLGARYDDTKIRVDEFLGDDRFQLCGNRIGAPLVLPPGVVCTGVGTASIPRNAGTFIPGLEVNFHNFSYKARLEYDLTPKNMVYGMVSTGFRPGDAGINSQTRAPNILKAETLTSFEVGSKNRFLGDSLQVNAGLFYYNYHSEGFRTLYQPNIFVPQIFFNVNVPLHNFGGEVELLYKLTAHDRIGLNGNYVVSRWYNKPDGFAAAYTNTKRALTPYTFTANYMHEFSLPNGSTLSTRVDARYEAAHPSTDLQAQYLAVGQDQYVQLGGRTIGNVSATWASSGGRYTVNGYVRNVTNEKFVNYGVGINLTQLGVTYSDPRTYGLQAAVRF
jgi:iron complex outermembrane receptor protein